MTIDIFTPTGTKKGSMDLPSSFTSIINKGLMHQVLMLQQSNRRNSIAHAKNRGEVAGSTRKLYSQKHTGRARRGSIRSPLLRGGGKAFGPRNNSNFIKQMPKSMRKAALSACLSYQAKQGAVVGLESYPDAIKTKTIVDLLVKMSVQIGRRTLIVVPQHHKALEMSSRNVPGVKTLVVSYLNPEDILGARRIIFLVDAIAKVEEWLAGKNEKMSKKPRVEKSQVKEPIAKKEKKPVKKTTKKITKKPAAKLKKSSESSASSAS